MKHNNKLDIYFYNKKRVKCSESFQTIARPNN